MFDRRNKKNKIPVKNKKSQHKVAFRFLSIKAPYVYHLLFW